MTKSQIEIHRYLVGLILRTHTSSPLLIGISGKDGSGKTSLADSLAEFVSANTPREVNRVSIDDFMNDRSKRYKPARSSGRGCYENTFDFDGFVTNFLLPIRSRRREYRSKIFDYASDTSIRTPAKRAHKDAIFIVDGVFLFKRELRSYWDIKVHLETTDATAIDRGARRDSERLGSYQIARRKYLNRYIASQKIYYREERPLQCADIVIDNNDLRNPHVMKSVL